MFFFKKINSEEYLELKTSFERLRIEVEALKLELQLYARKLKVSRGLKDKQDEEIKEPTKTSFLTPDGKSLSIS